MSARRGSKPTAVGAERSLTWLVLDPFVVGLPTESVASILEGRVSSVDRPSLELASVCGVEDADAEHARTLVLEGEPPVDLVVHEDVKVEAVRLEDIHPLPRYLEGLGTSLSLSALVARGASYGLLVDVASLRARAGLGGGT